MRTQTALPSQLLQHTWTTFMERVRANVDNDLRLKVGPLFDGTNISTRINVAENVRNAIRDQMQKP